MRHCKIQGLANDNIGVILQFSRTAYYCPSFQGKKTQGALIIFSIRVAFKWASMRENLSSGFAKNRGADQPAHPLSLISAFVIRLLENTIPKLAINKISIF